MSVKNMSVNKDTIPRVYGHRGASGYKVDNTITAFNLAIEQGADGVESDVYVTKDGVPFLFHDSTCKLKGAEEKIKVASLNSNQLSKIILPDDEQVPTLREFFDEFSGNLAKSGKKLRFCMDIQNMGSGAASSKLARAYDCDDQLELCHSFGPYFKNVRKYSDKVHLIASNSIRKFTFRNFQKSWSKYRKYNVETFNIKAADFKPEYMQILNGAGYSYYIWDLHDEERLRKYLPYRPNAIYSNYPDLALKIRKEILGQ
jgi:glycerophosphoryl diester phosphodiesterase